MLDESLGVPQSQCLTMIDLKNQIVDYDISKTRADRMVQRTWGPEGWNIEQWLDLVGARYYYGEEDEQPTIYVDTFSLFPRKTTAHVITEREFWTSFFSQLSPTHCSQVNTHYFRIYQTLDLTKEENEVTNNWMTDYGHLPIPVVEDEHNKKLEDVVMDLDDFYWKLEDGCYFSDNKDDYIIQRVEITDNPTWCIWVYENECSRITDAYPMAFLTKEDLEKYMEWQNGHGHLDQFPTNYIQPK